MRDRVVAVNPATGRRAAEIPTGVWGSALTVANGTLWRLQPHSLVGVDLASRRVRARMGLGQASYALAAARHAVWVASFDSNTLTKIDARSGRQLFRIHVPHRPTAVAATRGGLWLARSGARTPDAEA